MNFEQHMYERVKQMHLAFNHPVRHENEPPLSDFELIEMRFRLIKEESDELRDSLAQFDPYNYVRELCDIGVVATGAKLVTGISGYHLQDSEELAQWSVDDIETPYDVVWEIDMLRSNYDINSDNVHFLSALHESLIAIVVKCERIFPEFRLRENFDRVMDANMSKLMDSETAAKTVDFYKQYGVDVQSKYNEELDRWYVVRFDGKFMKPHNFKHPVMMIGMIDQTDRHSLV